jgi:hypothetical protein
MSKEYNYINGPANILRLEGKIDDKDKILYIFSDIHMNVNNQYDCNNDDALDIDSFFAQEFKNLDHEVDFFLEIQDVHIKEYNTTNKLKYILNLRKFFYRNFNINKKNKVSKSKKYDKVRFHYIDTRWTDKEIKDFLEYFIDEYEIFSYVHERLMTKSSLYYFTDTLNNSIDKFVLILKNLKEQFYNFKFVKKIKNKIRNTNISIKLNKHLQDFYKNFDLLKKILLEIKKDFNYIIKNTDYSNIHKQKYNDEYENNIFTLDKKIKKLDNLVGLQVDKYMDLFFLRRFLDKNYIKHSILYCGLAHTQDICNILIKDFDFKITHNSYDININKLNKEIKEEEVNEEAFFNKIIPDYTINLLNQCSKVNFVSGFY